MPISFFEVNSIVKPKFCIELAKFARSAADGGVNPANPPRRDVAVRRADFAIAKSGLNIDTIIIYRQLFCQYVLTFIIR